MPPHQAHASVADGDWMLVSEKRPCLVCGGSDRCSRGFAGAFACCVRTPSDWPVITGGWVHRLGLHEVEARVPPEVVTLERGVESAPWTEAGSALSVAS